MKDRRGGAGGDRFGVFPFSMGTAMGCMSHSAVSVADPHETTTTKKPRCSDPSSSSSSMAVAAVQGSEEGSGAGETTKAKAGSPPGAVAASVQRLIRGVKTSLSQMFAAAYGEEEDDEEEEREMVIGYPTDVQHVGHIGWDGHGGLSKVGGGAMGMVNAFSLPSSLSLHQLEVAMDQAAHA